MKTQKYSDLIGRGHWRFGVVYQHRDHACAARIMTVNPNYFVVIKDGHMVWAEGEVLRIADSDDWSRYWGPA